MFVWRSSRIKGQFIFRIDREKVSRIFSSVEQMARSIGSEELKISNATLRFDRAFTRMCSDYFRSMHYTKSSRSEEQRFSCSFNKTKIKTISKRTLKIEIFFSFSSVNFSFSIHQLDGNKINQRKRISFTDVTLKREFETTENFESFHFSIYR